MTAFAEFMQKVYQFLISQEFQSIVTAAIGVGTTIALISNRVAALKVANATVVTNRQNAQISDLKRDNEILQEKVDRLENKVTQQSAMFGLAFLNSKKLDPGTKQEIAKIVAEQTAPRPSTGIVVREIGDTISKVAETAKQVAEAPLPPAVQETAKSIFEKLTSIK